LDEHGLDGVQPVLRLLEDHGRGGDEHLVGDLGPDESVALVDPQAELGGGVVHGRKAMEEPRVGTARGRHHLRRDPIRGEQRNAPVPLGVGLAHADPHVGVDEGGAV
jgi:hypothetical protein